MTWTPDKARRAREHAEWLMHRCINCDDGYEDEHCTCYPAVIPGAQGQGEILADALAEIDALREDWQRDIDIRMEELTKARMRATAAESECAKLRAERPGIGDGDIRAALARTDAAEAKAAALEGRVAALASALSACIETAEEGWSYAGSYFYDKWDAAGQLAKARAALSGREGGVVREWNCMCSRDVYMCSYPDTGAWCSGCREDARTQLDQLRAENERLRAALVQACDTLGRCTCYCYEGYDCPACKASDVGRAALSDGKGDK